MAILQTLLMQGLVQFVVCCLVALLFLLIPDCLLHLQRQVISNADNRHMRMTTKKLNGIHQCAVLVCRYQAEPLTEEILIQEQQRAEDMLQDASAGIAPTATQSASDPKNTVAAAPSRHHCSLVSSHFAALQSQ